MSAVTAWASANPVLAGVLCALVTAGALIAARWVIPWCWREWRDLGPQPEPEVHHHGRVQAAAAAAPEVTLPAAVAEPMWLAAPVVDPYAGVPPFAGPAAALWPGDGFRAALAMNKRAEDERAGPPEEIWTAGCGGTPTPPVTGFTAAPSPKAIPAYTAAAAEPSASTPPGAPLPGYTAYAAALEAAAAERRAAEAAAIAEAEAWQAELRAEAAATSPWEDREPFRNWLSKETVARGIPVAALMAAVEEYAQRVEAAAS